MAARVTAHRFWSAPSVERVAAALLASASATAAPRARFEPDRHYRLVTREPGSERIDLPIWTSLPHAIGFEGAAFGPVRRTDVEGVPGAFVLSHVLTDHECDAIAALSESMGYTEDAPVSLGRRIRRNENCVIVADDTLWRPIWERVQAHMPKVVQMPDGVCAQPVGLNQRWRLYKYGAEDIFRMHTDGSWPGSGLDAAGGLERDLFGDRWSTMTFLIYLDGEYDGGETTFFVPSDSDPRTGELVSVSVPKGSVLCFFHGEHALSPLHEGSLVTRGLKRIVRSDVLYTLPGAPPLLGSAGADAAPSCAAE